MMDTDLPSVIPPQLTPHPDEPLGPSQFEGVSTEPSSPIAPDSTEAIGLNVVFDPPVLEGERTGQTSWDVGHSAGDVNEDPGNGGSWPSLLLLSYASAVTLALIWILWTGRRFPPSRVEFDESGLSAPEVAPGPSLLDAAIVDELPPQNLTSLGKPIQLGSVEVTPLAVERRHVELLRAIAPGESQRPKISSLVLRVRLRNVSPDRTFAPLELSSVRECPGIRNETFVESDRGRIGMYPLALESEWSLAGEQFPSLRPGESAETLIATAPLIEDKLDDALTWRIRLRVTPHQSDVLGVRFSRNQIVDR